MKLILNEGKLLRACTGLVCIDKDADVKIIEVTLKAGSIFLPKEIKGICSGAFEDLEINNLIVPLTVRSIDKNALVGVRTVVFTQRRDTKRMRLQPGWCNGVRRILIGDTLLSLTMRIVDKFVSA